MAIRRTDKLTQQVPTGHRRWQSGARLAGFLIVICVTNLLSGCAAFRPLDGVPARYLPDELRGRSKESMQMIDLSMLRRRPEAQYRVDTDDVLAVYIEGILGRADQPPINQQTSGGNLSQLNGDRPPTLGYPLAVRDDGTIAIPRFGPVLVRGRTIPEVENLVRSAFTRQQRFLTPMTQNRVVVSLHQPRKYRILVFRQDSEQGALSAIDIGNGQIGTSKRGNGRVVALPSGKNDVLHALVDSGGLPGLDARDTIWVIRSKQVPKPINQVAYNGTPQRGATMIPGYPQQPMMYPGMPLQPQMRPTPVQPMPGRPAAVQPMMPPGPPSHPGVAPQNFPPRNIAPQPVAPSMAPGHAIPGSGSPSANPNSGAIQQTNYLVMQTPKQFLENVTGIPMPPNKGLGSVERTQAAVGQGVRNAFGAVTSAGGIAASAVVPNGLAPAGVTQMSCDSCQSGSRMQNSFRSPMMHQPMVQQAAPHSWQPPTSWNLLQPGMNTNGLCNLGRTIRIPLRVQDCTPLNITEHDVELNDGDIIFIQSRDDEVFYTGGLLGGGQYTLPRDHDIDILEAIAIAQGRNQGSGGGDDFGRSALNNDVTISASQAVILRKLPNGSQVPILVDLYRARKYSGERVRIQPGDYIVLQYTRSEAIAAFIERHILETALFGIAAASLDRGR